MELNKCGRCGAFFTTNNNVCPNCEPQDKFEMAKLKNFVQKNITENSNPYSIEQLSCHTGITQKNINRFIAQDNILENIIKAESPINEPNIIESNIPTIEETL